MSRWRYVFDDALAKWAQFQKHYRNDPKVWENISKWPIQIYPRHDEAHYDTFAD